jgi:hypothetical protein
VGCPLTFGFSGASRADCPDPPDIVIEINGERWAVEVTGLDQRVRSATGARSRSDIDAKLMAFGRSVAAGCHGRVMRPYSLTLRPMPGVTDTKEWRANARRTLTAAIKRGDMGPLLLDTSGTMKAGEFVLGDFTSCAELRGYEIGDGGASNNVLVVVDAGRTSTPQGHAPNDILANLEEGLHYVLKKKSEKLVGKVDGFDRVALMLDNRYVLVDVADISAVAHRLSLRFPAFHSIYLVQAGAVHQVMDYNRAVRQVTV